MDNKPAESKPFRSSFFSQAYKQPTIFRNGVKCSDSSNPAPVPNNRTLNAGSMRKSNTKECHEKQDSSKHVSRAHIGDAWISKFRSQDGHDPSSSNEENLNHNQQRAPTSSTVSTDSRTESRSDDLRLHIVLDPDQFVIDLKELDPQKKFPLPCNIMWAWSEVDKKGTGKALKLDMHSLKNKFTDFVEQNINIENLIRLSDKEKDRVLTPKSMRRLLSVACATNASTRDLDAVMLRLAAVAAACAHGGYDETMTSDPLLLSRAIFEWWWIDCGHRARLLTLQRPIGADPLPRPSPPALHTPRYTQPRTAYAGSAATPIGRSEAGTRFDAAVDLSMDSLPCTTGVGQADSDEGFRISAPSKGSGRVRSARKPPEWVTQKVTWTS